MLLVVITFISGADPGAEEDQGLADPGAEEDQELASPGAVKDQGLADLRGLRWIEVPCPDRVVRKPWILVGGSKRSTGTQTRASMQTERGACRGAMGAVGGNGSMCGCYGGKFKAQGIFLETSRGSTHPPMHLPCAAAAAADGHGAGDPDDALTVWQYVRKAWGQRAQDEDEDEDDALTVWQCACKAWRQGLKQRRKQQENGRNQGTEKARHGAARKFWQRWRKRAAYMEELGEEAGNLLYKAEQAGKRQKQREKAKKKARPKGNRKPQK